MSCNMIYFYGWEEGKNIGFARGILAPEKSKIRRKWPDFATKGYRYRSTCLPVFADSNAASSTRNTLRTWLVFTMGSALPSIASRRFA